MHDPASKAHGALHHVEIYVADLPRAREFWGWWLGVLGWQPFQDWEQGFSMIRGDSYLVFVQSTMLDVTFHRCRPGLNHLAFHARDRAQVDELTRKIQARGLRLLYPERHPHAGGAGYYALFFEDPEGLKVELVAGCADNACS